MNNALIRSLWKPFLASVSFIICLALYVVATDLKNEFLLLGVVILAAVRLVGFIPKSRALGFMVFGSLLCSIAFIWNVVDHRKHPDNCAAIFGIGLAAGAFGWVNQYQMWMPRYNCFAPAKMRFNVNWFLLAFVVALFYIPGMRYADEALLLGIYQSVALFTLCLIFFHRQAIELALEPIVWLLYSVRRTGRTAYQLPPAGPLLIVANHSSWVDPVFLAKVLPRPITPMMTSKFYNIWFLRPLLKYVFKVIVVPDVKMRREAPELQLAIAALDRGEVVVIFPEGALRRKADVPLKRFGQGVHMILRDRPDTPVVSCWIEGAWGSFTSYFNGPPTKNKKMDFRRKISVALSEPEKVPLEVLEKQLPTRIYLMNRVLASREMLGLPPLPKVGLPAKDDEETV